jgi:hypothetical protein
MTEILRLQADGDDPLQVRRQQASGHNLADERKAQRAVRKDADRALEALVTPNHDLEVVARIDTVSRTGGAIVGRTLSGSRHGRERQERERKREDTSQKLLHDEGLPSLPYRCGTSAPSSHFHTVTNV